MPDAIIDWKAWFARKISAAAFDKRREPYLRYATYDKRFNDLLGGIAMVTTDLPKYVAKSKPQGLMVSTRRRLWSTLDWMSLQYSAGAPVTEIVEVWPHAMNWAEEYAKFHEDFHNTPEADNYITPHATLRDEEYWIVALRLTCFGLLGGFAHEMPRVMTFLAYSNEEMQVRDGLLERLVASYVPDRGIPPDTATRHLPYRKLFKVFAAMPEKRPLLMAIYLDEWYHASRREPYIDQHGESDYSFYGYWSWEAAATTLVLGIDDASYRDKSFYPRDLADFARSLKIKSGATSHPLRRPNVPAGNHCPETGWWFTPAQANSRRYFQAGAIMPAIENSAYGSTYWQWSPDQSAPTL